MRLSKLRIYIDNSVGDKCFQSHFNYHVFFIAFYLYKQFRQKKIEIEGINIIDIVVGGDLTDPIKFINNRCYIHVPFDMNLYTSDYNSEKCLYYTQLVKEAFDLLAKERNIPCGLIMDLINTLKQDDYVYQWKFKTISLSKNSFKICFYCHLTTNDFTMTMEVNNLKEKRNILRDTIIRTKPDEIFFSHISNKIKIDEDWIFISTKWDVDLIMININDLREGKLTLKYCKSPYPNDQEASNDFFMLQRELKYDNDDFI